MFLNPIGKRRNKHIITETEEKKFAVCDIESSKWDKFIVIGSYDGRTYQYFNTLGKFFKHVFESEENYYFAHFGGKFDFLFLLKWLFKNPDKFMVEGIIPRGSLILCFTIVKGNREIKFWDSTALLPFKLQSLCENFNVPTKKGKIDYNKITKITPKLIKYLESDCKGLHEVLTAFYNWPIIVNAGRAFTIASQAMKVFRSFLDSPIPGLRKSVDEIIRKSYFGGRTEIFKPYFSSCFHCSFFNKKKSICKKTGKKTILLEDNKEIKCPLPTSNKKELFCYDANSLYPYVMRNFDYPGKYLGTSKSIGKNQLGFYDVTVNVPQMYCPPLPYKDQTKLIFPCGKFRGIYTKHELENAVNNHNVKIIKIHKCYIFKNMGKIFKKYVDILYDIRLNSKSEIDSIIAKLLLNALYGKFGIKNDKEIIEFEKAKAGEKFFKEININGEKLQLVSRAVDLEGFSHVGISSYVTSYARVHMYNNYWKPLSLKNDLYYLDTDSLFTTSKLKESKELGEVKLEFDDKDKKIKSTHEACFLLPKSYKTDHKIKMKGFDRKATQFSFAEFADCLQGEMYRMEGKKKIPKIWSTQNLDENGNPKGLMTFKSALKRKKTVLIRKEKEIKGLISSYDKRLIINKNDLTKINTSSIIIS